ncbi:MAG: potassium channel protein [Thermodesulfobacteriota bacterium]|nr:potassium channel protein [Thermodesulfobacteriota bacterium]
MYSTKNTIILTVLSLIVFVSGIIGYMVIEDWSFLDAIYMTVITLTTVGFGEVHHLSRDGKIFTTILIFVGVGFCLYVVGTFVQFILGGQINNILGRRKLDKKISQLDGHCVVCGYGRIGRVLALNLINHPIDVVVVEQNPDLVPIMGEDNVLYVSGSATEEEALIAAGIKKAKTLVAVLATDTDNVFLVLTARQLNPDLYIMARSSQERVKSKLRAAGADKVESPYDTGALSMAKRVLRPTVTNFLDLALAQTNKDIQMEEVPVSPRSKLCGKTLQESRIRQDFNLIIIAIRKSDNTMIFNPSSETRITENDTIVAVGDHESLNNFNRDLLYC